MKVDCQFCWDVAEVLAEAGDSTQAIEYDQLHEHAHRGAAVYDGGSL
ncbi:hypothetical protein SEA_GOIB_75 [Gordonia phage Goib]|uniref:Uncharacterized protein n=2 Tax=Vendettavirus vendetta TaxID=2049886 RepID=A0A160DD73_9CAUD|nr:hypothetical protein BH795_gp36 [Gordonia phage Vendetta]YP_009275429.1 hypothetical protein BH760_gp36 [Gordonia phage Splinter]ANA85622.1 hypothetical protein PBI_VENDETTA_75 [Gordonia phage Vendetta]ANA85701.1 hypothetical protein PBI_SPLINTER_75 [Gordonia phage Splinter]WNO25817.1 hypothetical protein SEA_GOIB_75 [Gordonia phage Goib]